MADRLLSWFQQRNISYLNNELLKAAKIGYAARLVKVLQRLFRAEGISVLPSGEQHGMFKLILRILLYPSRVMIAVRYLLGLRSY